MNQQSKQTMAAMPSLNMMSNTSLDDLDETLNTQTKDDAIKEHIRKLKESQKQVEERKLQHLFKKDDSAIPTFETEVNEPSPKAQDPHPTIGGRQMLTLRKDTNNKDSSGG
jgi:hypothetical protein